jgi:hypothetical protein
MTDYGSPAVRSAGLFGIKPKDSKPTRPSTSPTSFAVDADISNLITTGREEKFRKVRPPRSAAPAAQINLERGEYGKASKEA